MSEAISLDDYVKHALNKTSEHTLLFERFMSAWRRQPATTYEQRPPAMPIRSWVLAFKHFSKEGKIPNASCLNEWCPPNAPLITLREFARVDSESVLKKIRTVSNFETKHRRHTKNSAKTREAWNKALYEFANPTTALPCSMISAEKDKPSDKNSSRRAKNFAARISRPFQYPWEFARRLAPVLG